MLLTKKKDSALSNIKERNGNGTFQFTKGNIKTVSSDIYNVVDSFSEVVIQLEFTTKENHKINNARIDIGINNILGDRIAWLSSDTIGDNPDLSYGKINFHISNLPLAPGDYNCNLYCETNNELADWLTDVIEFSVTEKDYYGTGKAVPSNQGDILLNYKVVI